MHIQAVTDRECFTVEIDWKDIPQLLSLSKENSWYFDYLNSHPIEFRFMSFLDRELQPKDTNIAYYCTLGFVGDNNQYDLGLWGGKKEELLKLLETDDLINKLKTYPYSYDCNQFNKIINELKFFYQLSLSRIKK